jgi:hypothetical protein
MERHDIQCLSAGTLEKEHDQDLRKERRSRDSLSFLTSFLLPFPTA